MRVDDVASNICTSQAAGERRRPRHGQADIARHVTDTHFEPSCIELNGILRRGEQYLPGPLPSAPSTRILNPRVLS
jgi:hypothetical protein